MNMIKDQKNLYHHFDFPEPSKPTILSESLMAMRLNFLLEELIETAESAGFFLDSKDISPEESEIKFKPVKEGEIDASGILDGLIDMTVVLFGTAYLMGFLNDCDQPARDNLLSLFKDMPDTYTTPITIFEEAWRRVYEANLKKEVGVRDKRGHEMDLKKPEGWLPPNLDDLVGGFFGVCKDCGNNKQSHLSLKCEVCEML